jgi:hypothetical protein
MMLKPMTEREPKIPQTTQGIAAQLPGVFALFKGESGSGKSTAALSFPNPYIFDFDKKLPGVSLKHFPEKDIHWNTFNDIFEIEDQLNWFKKECPYETLIADSFTALANICIASVGLVKQESVPDILQRVQSTRGKDGGSKQIEMMGIDYYNAEDRFMTYFIDQLKVLWARPGNPQHVIVTAHVVTEESAPDIKTKIVTKTRRIVSKGRKPAAWLPTEFDNMFIFGHQLPDLGVTGAQVRRICVTESYGEDSAKCILPLPAEIDFTNGSLYDKMFPHL